MHFELEIVRSCDFIKANESNNDDTALTTALRLVNVNDGDAAADSTALK